MKIAIMQPYFFPYIGYWQLMNHVDIFVIYDDVNFIKGGWINRNRIILGGEVRYFNLPMLGISPNKLINEVMINKSKKEISHTLSIIREAYRKAPYFEDIFQMLQEIFNSNEITASGFLSDSFRFICLYLGIKTQRIISSDIPKQTQLRREDKVINICENLGADEYINPIGGIELYDKDYFKNQGISLSFMQMNQFEYKQSYGEFIPNLSIIDAMMFNDRETVRGMLEKYTLV